MKKDVDTLDEALKKLLRGRKAGTQEDICSALEKMGYEINQSKVSRLLRKTGAIKVVDERGRAIYSLPREPAPPSMTTPICDLILDVVSNEAMVVIFTAPGAASMVARVLDYNQISTPILGSIAGDDTIFVAPKSIKDTQKMLLEIKAIFGKHA